MTVIHTGEKIEEKDEILDALEKLKEVRFSSLRKSFPSALQRSLYELLLPFSDSIWTYFQPPLPILQAAEGRRYMTDSFNQLQILSTYQQVLHHSARNVSENQESLITKIIPTMAEAHKHMQTCHRLGQEIAHFEAQLKLVEDISGSVQHAQDQLIHIISFLDQIESILPEEFNTPTTPKKSSPTDASDSQDV